MSVGPVQMNRYTSLSTCSQYYARIVLWTCGKGRCEIQRCKQKHVSCPIKANTINLYRLERCQRIESFFMQLLLSILIHISRGSDTPSRQSKFWPNLCTRFFFALRGRTALPPQFFFLLSLDVLVWRFGLDLAGDSLGQHFFSFCSPQPLACSSGVLALISRAWMPLELVFLFYNGLKE